MSEKLTADSYDAAVKRRKTLKSYASRVFKESSVGVVSSVAQTASSKRKIFKVLAFLLCLTGFLYQSGTYLSVVLQYPTDIDIDVVMPTTYIVPGYTFCFNNQISRKLFCDNCTECCEEPSEEFCNKYEGYCGENKTLVPKKEYYLSTRRMVAEDIMKLNEPIENFVRKSTGENITGPYLRAREYADYLFQCYSLNDRINNSFYPKIFKRNPFFKEPVDELRFKINEQDIFLPGNRPGLLFAVHSPFQAVNPLETGTFMRPGRTYMVYVSVDEEIMEKRPYDTDCVNYTEIWEKNGRTGYRLQEMCKQNCYSDFATWCYKCNMHYFYFPRPERLCTVDELDRGASEECVRVFKSDKRIAEICDEKCRDDCSRTKYRYTVQERFNPKFNENGEPVKENENTINVNVYIEDDEVVIYKHSPKYMLVEVFSSIGGFIGIWLGMSLLDVTDIFEGFYRIFRYSLKRK